MAIRPAKCYRELKKPAYTRTAKKVMKKAFITGVPGSRLRIYDMGQRRKGRYAYPRAVNLVAKEPMQLRHNQLEAARVAINRNLRKLCGNDYYFKIRKIPHHVLRENKMATGAGADRFSQGMRRSFGKPIGVAARVKPGDIIMSCYVPEEKLEAAKKAMKVAKHKLSCKIRVEIKKQKVDKKKASLDVVVREKMLGAVEKPELPEIGEEGAEEGAELPEGEAPEGEIPSPTGEKKPAPEKAAEKEKPAEK